jgi:hypothetical protein
VLLTRIADITSATRLILGVRLLASLHDPKTQSFERPRARSRGRMLDEHGKTIMLQYAQLHGLLA